VQEYQNSSLREYFEEDALLFPVDTIIGKLYNNGVLLKMREALPL
jgi:hypothetical protein